MWKFLWSFSVKLQHFYDYRMNNFYNVQIHHTLHSAIVPSVVFQPFDCIADFTVVFTRIAIDCVLFVLALSFWYRGGGSVSVLLTFICVQHTHTNSRLCNMSMANDILSSGSRVHVVDINCASFPWHNVRPVIRNHQFNVIFTILCWCRRKVGGGGQITISAYHCKEFLLIFLDSTEKYT